MGDRRDVELFRADVLIAPDLKSCSFSQGRSHRLSILLSRRGHVSLLIPKPKYSFLNLSLQIIWQVNNVDVFSFAVVRLVGSLRHSNGRFLAFRLNDLYVRNADTVDTHSHESS